MNMQVRGFIPCPGGWRYATRWSFDPHLEAFPTQKTPSHAHPTPPAPLRRLHRLAVPVPVPVPRQRPRPSPRRGNVRRSGWSPSTPAATATARGRSATTWQGVDVGKLRVRPVVAARSGPWCLGLIGESCDGWRGANPEGTVRRARAGVGSRSPRSELWCGCRVLSTSEDPRRWRRCSTLAPFPRVRDALLLSRRYW